MSWIRHLELMNQGYNIEPDDNLIDDGMGPDEREEMRRADLIETTTDIRLKQERKKHDDEDDWG